MSLEATLTRTNELLEALIASLSTRNEAAETLGAPEEKTTRKRRTKAEIEADNAAAAAAATPKTEAHTLAPVEGDPEGTRYWLIADKNTVYAERPGDPAPNLPGAVIVSATEYLAKKEEFAKKFAHLSQAAAEPTTAPAAAPAQSTPAASTASSDTVSVSFKQVVDKLQELNRSTAAGHGRDGVMAVLTKFGKTRVPELESVGDNAAVLAAVEAILNAPAADDLGL